MSLTDKASDNAAIGGVEASETELTSGADAGIQALEAYRSDSDPCSGWDLFRADRRRAAGGPPARSIDR